MRTLLASLTDHPMAVLRGIAELRDVPLATNARDDAAGQLAAALADPVAAEATVAACSSGAQAAWQALRSAGGRIKTPIFGRDYGAIRPLGPGRLEREQTWREPASPAEELWFRGLIFRAFADLGDGPAEYVYIPDELLPPALQRSTQQSGSPPSPSLTAVAAPGRPRQTLNSLAVDLCAVLAGVREMPIRLDAAGQVREADAARLREGLLLPDPVRLDLLLALARGRGWLKPDRDRLVLDVGATTVWLRATHWEQMSSLFAAWRESTDPLWNDLRRVPSLRAEGAWRNDPPLARRALLDPLRSLPGNAWYAVADLVAWLKAHTPDFQRPDGNYTLWYLRDAETGRYLSGFESWDDVEGRLIRFLMTGPLFWLGAVELGIADCGLQIADFASAISNPKSAILFRLTPAGAAWLAGRMPAELPRPASLVLADDFTVTAPLLLPLRDRFRLLRFTEPAQPKEIESLADGGLPDMSGPTRHRITRGSLARARAAGVKAEAILAFLRRATYGRVPPRVEAALTRFDQHGGAVRVTRGAVLRVEDAGILAALRADAVIAPLLGDLLSAQAVVVREANLAKLLKALEELGYAAKVE
ncbi:MAG: helicase-associated domain-containing protein [Chloroflexi bacterium]|nr:helicase-associated domain-containing protein [Chloroflexota bacterium]